MGWSTMPLIGLYMKCEMEGIAKITFPGTLDWRLDVKQANGPDVRENITLNSYDEFETSNDKVKANFLVKWDGAKQQSTMSVYTPTHKDKLKDLKDPSTLGQYTADDNNKMSPIVIFDCRGIEPSKWIPCGPFEVETPSGKKFEGVDLTDPDGWFEFDDKAEAPVQIERIEFDFKVVR